MLVAILATFLLSRKHPTGMMSVFTIPLIGGHNFNIDLSLIHLIHLHTWW